MPDGEFVEPEHVKHADLSSMEAIE